MQTILCYGDSNTWGCIPLTGAHPPRRYGPAQRWPGVLRRELGDGFWIVEEGLNARTTVWDDPLEPFRSGKELLAPCLLTHQPLDLVLIMLGTNDLKGRFGVGARDIDWERSIDLGAVRLTHRLELDDPPGSDVLPAARREAHEMINGIAPPLPKAA